MDAQFNLFNVDLVDTSYSGGLYTNGNTTLHNFSLEGGHLYYATNTEVVMAYEQQGADGYAKDWMRYTLGMNYFFYQHDIKVQLAYRDNENYKGQINLGQTEIFVQGQYTF